MRRNRQRRAARPPRQRELAPAATRGADKWAIFAIVTIAATVVTAYFPVFSAGFTNWDDDRFITDNPLFHGPIRAYVMAALTRVQFQAYHPLHLLSYLPDRLLRPYHAPGFHALNLALFIAALALVYFLLRRTLPGWPALAATLLVGLAPQVVEPVAWVVGRKDVLALLFALAALLVLDRTPATRRSTVIACVLAACAALSKTSAVVLPVVCFAWLSFVRELTWREAARRCWPFAAIALVFAVPVPFIWRENHMIPPSRPLPLVLDVTGTVGVYLEHLIVPTRLSPVYPSLAPGQALAGLLTIAGLLAVVAFWRRLPQAARFAVVVFLGCLLPVANITPVYFRFADRYALFAVIMLAWPIGKLLAWRRLRGAALLVVPVLGLQMWLTMSLVPSWNDSLALWQHATAAQPAALYGYLKLGETYRGQQRYREAAAAYLRAGQLDPFGSKGPAGLFVTLCERAEGEGRIPRGSGNEWQQEIAQNGLDAHRMDALIASVDLSGCRPCAEAMLWLGLRMFPQSDRSLVSLARKAAERGRAKAALVYLNEVRDRNTEGLAEVMQLLEEQSSTMKKDPGGVL